MAPRKTRPKPALKASGTIEWVIAAVSLAIVLGLMGYLTVQALDQRDGHPALTLRTIDTHAVPTGTAVTVEVRNDGEATAAGVEIAASGDDGQMAGATLDYVPADSQREITLVFADGVDPAGLSLEVLGYSEP